MGTFITSSKIIGTVSLGLLSGYTLSVDDLPQRTQARLPKILGIVSVTSLSAAFLFGGPRNRHPYLVYALLGVPISAVWSSFQLGSSAKLQDEPVTPPTPGSPERSQLDSSVYEDIGSGEKQDTPTPGDDTSPTSEAEVHTSRSCAFIRYGPKVVTTLAFVIATIGIYGDMY
ncbi:hypothetical protein TRVA0_006S01618 [Trichomonascus vanleenenianus]|uniref:Atg33p n=1 Tax=Trichomonascus vanleenenianus TaxID=2268995 RepID=UPI003ECA80D1